MVEAGAPEAARPAHLRPRDADPRHRRARCATLDFPTQWHDSDEAGLTFPISYHFEPGAADDGLTIDVPVATLNRIDADDFSWLVPGLREELVTELIRSLPKNLRVALVPAPNTAREFLAATPPGAEPLLDALERFARSTRSLMIDREAWDWSKVPEHLRPTYRVLTEEGAEAGRGKDLDALKEPLRPDLRAGDGRRRRRLRASPRPGRRRGPSARVEESFVQRRAGHEVRGFPALVDEGSTVGLRSSRPPTRPPRTTGSAYAAWCCSRSARPTPVDDVLAAAGLDQRAKLALVGSPYPSVADLLADLRAGAGRRGRRRPARRCATRRRTTPWWPRARGAVAGGLDARRCTT